MNDHDFTSTFRWGVAQMRESVYGGRSRAP
jgi:hypothetical protein